MKITNFTSSSFWKEIESFTQTASIDKKISNIVSSIIEDISENGIKAANTYTKKFDGANIDENTILVSKEEFELARELLLPENKSAILQSIASVQDFAKKTLPKSWRQKNLEGATVGENFYPIQRVGIYIPGGTAPLVSTVIMTSAIAKVASCPSIAVCTPCDKNGNINSNLLAALDLVGIKEVYKIGGAQAIALMALGDEKIKKVDKIFGPGNAFVVEAKRQFFGTVGIDLLPGPSEAMVISDASSCAKHTAADLLSQAEHGSGREKIYFVSTSKDFIEETFAQMIKQKESLNRNQMVDKVLENGILTVLVDDLDQACEVANFVAPEHLELHVDPSSFEHLLENIKTAGAILLGGLTPTAMGDFIAGPSHTLPTGRTGVFASGLQTADFMRRSSIVCYDKASLEKSKDAIIAFSKMEFLDAHGKSLEIRL